MTLPARRHVRTASGLVTVERRTITGTPATARRWSRGEVHDLGNSAVSRAFCPAGGAIDGVDRRRLLVGCATSSATQPGNRVDPSNGTLAADVSRLLAHGPLRFPSEMMSDEVGVR